MPGKSTNTSPCGLCERQVEQTTRHHLVPRSQGGEVVVQLCIPCHKTIHALFENRTLAQHLHSVQSLREAPELVPWLKWIRRQPDRTVRVYRSRKFRR